MATTWGPKFGSQGPAVHQAPAPAHCAGLVQTQEPDISFLRDLERLTVGADAAAQETNQCLVMFTEETLDDGGTKGVFLSVHLIPRVALCDPDLTATMPRRIAAGRGLCYS